MIAKTNWNAVQYENNTAFCTSQPAACQLLETINVNNENENNDT